VRTIIDLPAEQLDDLADLCRRDGISRAEAIRRAVASYVERQRSARPARAFGLWRARPVESLTYERRLRQEWDTAEPSPKRPRKRR